MNKEYLLNNPKYVEYLKKMLKFEENNKKPDSAIIENKDYDTYWSSSDVGVNGSSIYQLEMNGFVERVYDSNKHTDYALINREEIKEMIDEIEENYDDGIQTVMHNFPSPEELPDDVFDDVIGYEDVKWLLKRGMTTDDITNFLLIGPPGSAKTVFLMCINDIEDAEFVPSMDASSAGFIEVMFEKKPKYMLLDEIDDMDKEHQKSLSSYMETGIVKETKHRKTREMKTNTKTIATANNTGSILDHIEDRFTTLYFEPYTRDEYIEVCTHILPRNEGKEEEESQLIAEAIWERYGEGDVRKAIQVARLSRGDPERVISVLDKYSKDEILQLMS